MLVVHGKWYGLIVCLVGCSLSVGNLSAQTSISKAEVAHTSLGSAGSDEALAFTKNLGQWPDSILFRAEASATTMWFTKNGIWYQFIRTVARPNNLAVAIGPSVDPFDTSPVRPGHKRDSIELTMIKAEFVGTSESVEVIGNQEMEYRCNFFIGNDPTKWHSNVPNFRSVTMRGLYPGVNVTFAAIGGRLQEELNAVSSTGLTQVKVEYRVANEVITPTDGVAMIQTSFRQFNFESALLADQSVTQLDRQVASAASDASGLNLVYSTYLGGSSNEGSSGIAIDDEGNAYVTGGTYSADFPTQSPYQPYITGVDGNAYVTKLNSAGNGLIYSTYLGGSGDEGCSGIAVDAGGNAYVTGYTLSANFPTQGPFQATIGGGYYDAFVTKINNLGSDLIYSTYLGGSGDEGCRGIAVDIEGGTYVTGSTSSADFPTQIPFQGSLGGNHDAFVTKLNSAGSGMDYSSYLGGSGDEAGHGIAVDAGESAFLTGVTSSENFPTVDPFQAAFGGGTRDAFVTKLNSAGNELIYSTYLGGSGEENYDWPSGIAVDSNGSAYVTGNTNSTYFPTQNPFQASLGGNHDAFVTKFSSTGSELTYSTFLGGTNNDFGRGIDVDVAGNAYVIGTTASINFPTQIPIQESNGGNYDAFITELNPSGSRTLYSTYIGGIDYENGASIKVNVGRNAYVTGLSVSGDFPTLSAFQASYGGMGDAFVAKIGAYCCDGAAGNLDHSASEVPDLSDLSWLIAYLTQVPHPPIPCPAEADVNGSAGEAPDLQDLSLLIAFFTMTPRPELPGCQ